MRARRQSTKNVQDRWLNIREVRLVSDLRIMHSKVDELHQVVQNLTRRHSEESVINYADDAVLTENIVRVEQIYLWFVSLKKQRGKTA
ncbi:MAG TPA: hypothetical protein VH196_06475 [Terriglobales bacterium]|nr:hypothetical protein [Terriglobales bacterium]